VAENSPHHPEVKGLNLATAAATKMEQMAKKKRYSSKLHLTKTLLFQAPLK
jgi:hypothetical protein